MKVPEDKRFVVSGLALKPDDARNNPALTEAARRLGRQLAESIK
jgi:hypothetical protein